MMMMIIIIIIVINNFNNIMAVLISFIQHCQLLCSKTLVSCARCAPTTMGNACDTLICVSLLVSLDFWCLPQSLLLCKLLGT